MPRERANNYALKTKAILDAAAVLFARTGYPEAKMQDIAKACSASKSMLYHYFFTKDDMLFAMLKEHLEDTILSLEEAPRQKKSRRSDSTCSSMPSCKGRRSPAGGTSSP